MKYFWPYRFDDATGELWRHGVRVSLTPKASDVLRCLIGRPGLAVSTAQVLSDVWPGVHVQAANVKALVRELRGALDDHHDHPRFIRSESGRGYTFMAGVTHTPVPLCTERAEAAGPELVAHDDELRSLVACVDAARDGATRVVLVEGERWIGKTSLCRRLAHDVWKRGAVRITCGQTAGLPGCPEPFAPIVDALALLLRQYPALSEPFRAAAPAWAARIKAESHPDYALRDSGQMLRELAAALTVFSRDSTLLLVLEDLQWADASTLEAIRYLARTSTPTGTCLVATFCTRRGPLALDLERLARELAHEPTTLTVRLQTLPAARLEEHLVDRYGHTIGHALVAPLMAASAGHPYVALLAISRLVAIDGLQRCGSSWTLKVSQSDLSALFAGEVSDTWRQNLDGLDRARRRVLEACACVGPEFRAEDVAPLLRVDIAGVKRELADEAVRGLLVERVRYTGAAGAMTMTFGFRSPVVLDLLAATASTSVGLVAVEAAANARARRA